MPPLLPFLGEAAIRSGALALAVGLMLKLAKVRSPQTRMRAWSGVLMASVAMPVLMRWPVMPVLPLPSLTAPVMPSGAVPHIAPGPEFLSHAVRLQEAPLIGDISWYSGAMLIYGVVSALLLARLAYGLWRAHHLCAGADSVRATWTGGRDVRISPKVDAPVTIGTTILLPVDAITWEEGCRRAVLTHEGAHVDRRDFHLLLLATLHRAVFWFSPAAWVLSRVLAYWAEVCCDAVALADIGDRSAYAAVLLSLTERSQAGRSDAGNVSFGVSMAAHATLSRRMDLILADPPGSGAVGHTLALLSLLPMVLLSVGAHPWAAPGPTGDDAATIAARMVEQARARTAVALALTAEMPFIGYYATPFAPTTPFKVFQQGGKLMGAYIGQTAAEMLPENDHVFFFKDMPMQMVFQRDATGAVTAVVLHMNGYELSAYRLDDAAGRALEQALAERVAANQPQPGAAAALRTHISQLQHGDVDAQTLAYGMADAVRALLPRMGPAMAALGPVIAVRFDGVGADGLDIYTVTHVRGERQWRIRLAYDGRIEAIWCAAADPAPASD